MDFYTAQRQQAKRKRYLDRLGKKEINRRREKRRQRRKRGDND